MSRTSLIISTLMLIILSCEDRFRTDCNSCLSTSDYSVLLEIKYRNPESVPGNPIVTLYEGNISDSIILERFYIENPYSHIAYNAILYKDYSATLEFTYNGRKYITVGAACPKVRYDETTCDEPCWYLYDNIIDLRLRYD